MRAFAYFAAALSAAVLVEVALPDRAVFHTGWYNVGLLALAVLTGVYLRSALHQSDGVARGGVAALALGVEILAFAGIANGLFAPDPRLLAGVPGEQVQVAALGATIGFPYLNESTAPALLRRGRAALPITGERYIGSFVLRPVMRTVVRVRAYDAAGAHLTVTQPTGSVFLSPVLAMRNTQRISGLVLPYDTFALPAVHRIVNVVLFSAQQIAALRNVAGSPGPAVLFAVDDAGDRPLPHAIRLARSGETIEDGGVRLRADIVTYPAVDVIAAPSLPAVAVALALIAGGFAAYAFRTRLRS